MNFQINTNEDWLIFSDYLEENNQLDKADFIRNQLEDSEPNWNYEYKFGASIGSGVGGSNYYGAVNVIGVNVSGRDVGRNVGGHVALSNRVGGGYEFPS